MSRLKLLFKSFSKPTYEEPDMDEDEIQAFQQFQAQFRPVKLERVKPKPPQSIPTTVKFEN